MVKQELCEQDSNYKNGPCIDIQTRLRSRRRKLENKLEIDYMKAKLEGILLVILAFGKDGFIDPIS
jgi:hypothetical protein